MIKICIISFPWASNTPYKFLTDILKIFNEISNDIILINGNTKRIDFRNDNIKIKDIGINMHYVNNVNPKIYSIILWIIKCIFAQIKISIELMKSSNEIDIVIFYVAYPYFVLPLLTAKILGKTTIEIVTRTKYNSKSILKNFYGFYDKILFSLLDYISPETESLISQLNFHDKKNKILKSGARYIDINNFKIELNINNRNYIGYIGRLRKEKGVMNFINTIPLLYEYDDINFMIGGDGDLYNEIKAISEKNNKIKLMGWIPEEKLNNYYNELKLLVLPTQHNEGLPTILLEAMASGTIVLSTPIGGVIDIIKDGETGFLMENNSPECIKSNIIRVLNHPNLEKISYNARNLIEKKYSFEASVERFKKIINIEI